MHMVEYLSITLFALWCVSEIVISLKGGGGAYSRPSSRARATASVRR
jgi:hypothetical protein